VGLETARRVWSRTTWHGQCVEGYPRCRMNSAWVALPHPSGGIGQPVAEAKKTVTIKSDDTGPQGQMSVPPRSG
jgi:hypothetical protein